jgi:hypothetical protein
VLQHVTNIISTDWNDSHLSEPHEKGSRRSSATQSRNHPDVDTEEQPAVVIPDQHLDIDDDSEEDKTYTDDEGQQSDVEEDDEDINMNSDDEVGTLF